jgi:hypothetical protein
VSGLGRKKVHIPIVDCSLFMSNVKSLIRISAGLLVLGSIGVAAQAQAQTVDMPFDGNVPGSCTFGTVTPGVLTRFSPVAVMAAGGGVVPPTLPGGGTAARVTVTCTGNSALTVAAPTGTAPAGYVPTTVQAIVQKATNGAETASAKLGPVFDTVGPWNQPMTTTMPLTVGPTQLNVSLAVGAGGNVPNQPIVPTGNYSYKVNLSITGN